MKNFTSKLAASLFLLMLLATNANADIVISKIFYAGTKRISDGKNYTGNPEYIELYNNSDEGYDIAGMYIALVESESSTGAYLVKDQTNNYVKLKQVFQLPETEHKVPAWGTVVLAASAVNHADAVGELDLSKADYEFGGLATDNPDVPNLTLKFTYVATMPYLNLANGGDAGVLLITKNNGDKYLNFNDENALVFANGKDKGNQYLNFNAYYAMDAVEILKAKKNTATGKYEIDPDRKRICTSKDAGYVPVPDDLSMNKDGYIAYRKTALNVDGNIHLYDTQDSRVDFQVSNTIGVGEYDETPAGTTPVKVTIPESGYLPFNAEQNFFTEKGVNIGYVSISSGNPSFNDKPGHETIASNSPYLLIGAPGEHTIYYTEASRTLASAGADNWIADGDEKYADGVLTITTKNRFPMKFVNEKGNPRFVSDPVDGNKQKLNINVATEGRFYINHTLDTVSELKWAGITPEEVTGVEDGIVNVSTASNAVYSIQGVKMTGKTLAPGVYVKNGKAFVVK